LSRFSRPLLATATALLALAALPVPASAEREIPVGLANVNDQNLRDGRWLYAIRFVVDRDTTMYRFFSQMKAKGARWDEHPGPKCSGPGDGCYAAGDGGRIEARLVSVRPDGTPDLSNVLAQETVDPRTRYSATKAAYDIDTISLFWYFNMGGVAIKADTPYAMVYRNVDPDPANNFSSANSPTVKESEAGPNGRNNMDPDAPGAIAGLDPREAVAWSEDGGASWSWGRRVGPYFGSTTSDDGVRLPHYAWQASPTSQPESNQPYSAYWGTCSPCRLVARHVPRATTLTEAGGYAPVGKSVGIVTVRNLRTGESGHTWHLGSGIAKGRLDHPVHVKAGEGYEITHTGTVFRAEADNYVVKTVSVGTGPFAVTTDGFGPDRAELFALPHPYYAGPGRTPHARGVRVRSASFVPHAPRISARHASVRRVLRRLRVHGDVSVARARRGVAVQIRRAGRWRTVGRGRVRRGGRFAVRLRVAMRPTTRVVRLRAVARNAGRSHPVKVRTRR
jgi:hypothetical protein